MSRVLDKLVANYKITKRLRYNKHYSASDVELQEIKVLEKTLEEIQEKSPQTIKTLNTDDSVIDELIEMYLKNPDKLEEDLKKDSNVEKNDYRYRILPRIYSDIERISCSPHLERKLISYYLRNRRREKMHRLYGKSNRYFSKKSVDHLLHEIYMELGRTLYFSRLDNLKSKLKELPAVGDVIKVVSFIIKMGSNFMNIIKKVGLKEAFARILGGSAGIKILVYMISSGILQYLGWHETAGGPFEDILATIKYNMLVILGIIILPALVGLIVYFIAKAVISGIQWVRNLLRPKAIKVYIKGIKLLYTVLPAFAKLLSKKQMDIDSALKLLSEFVEAAKGSEEAQQSVINTINQLNPLSGNLGKYVSVSDIGDLGKILRKGSGYKFKFTIAVADFVKGTIGGLFSVGDVLNSDFFIPKQYFDLSKIAQSGEPDIGLPDGNELPIELAILIMFTSPEITLTMNSDKAQATLTFKALDFFTRYGELKEGLVVDFLNDYMDAFAETRGQLSEIFKKAYDEKKHEA
jgi:hypothetical protein